MIDQLRSVSLPSTIKIRLVSEFNNETFVSRKEATASRFITEQICIVLTVGTSSPSTVKPGRPRSAETNHVIRDAVLEMMNEGATLTSLSLVSISQRAGVSRNAIYRRWKSKERLLLDVVRSIQRPAPAPTEHSAREKMVMALDSFTRDIDTRALRLERAIIAEAVTFPELYEYFTDVVVAPLCSVLKLAIRAGKESGEIRVDVDENQLVAVLVTLNRVRVSDGDVWNIDTEAGSQHLVDLMFDGVVTA